MRPPANIRHGLFTAGHLRPTWFMVVPMLQIRHYQNWLQATRGLSFDNYEALWRWSVTDIDAFWQSIWDYFEVQSPTAHTAVLGRRAMPGAEWFPGAQGNYA